MLGNEMYISGFTFVVFGCRIRIEVHFSSMLTYLVNTFASEANVKSKLQYNKKPKSPSIASVRHHYF
ncbi:uncharacterized protein PHALS_14706 [Plasmopara halstedii]|uniref:Uncharacterized protein n=1 Tax=Plasmopara halstedii TaxID=4781 RepID=A0A0P1AP96_PLAHL|nr:uncharacterized protein PHALS_14706 [Plasmopara halstedii]CEG43373.1 hypothetical protein PHALS_14706 [Plasmopara halstedii]|eukprot:XP_024579742.1 hypothetical protein PHALS_14706 [Plasmopara halstedii]